MGRTTMKHPLAVKILAISAFGCGLVLAPIVNAADSGWFLTGDIGPSFISPISLASSTPINTPPEPLFKLSTTKLSFKTGVRLDLDGGYQFNDSWALEAEAGFTYNAVDFANGVSTVSRSLYQVPLLLNGIYTVPVKWCVKPYIGAGMGGVATGLNGLNDVGAAGQFLAGLKFKLSSRIDVGLGYKFLITAKHDWDNVLKVTQSGRTINNSILADVTFKF